MTSIHSKIFEMFKNLKSDAMPKPPRPHRATETRQDPVDENDENIDSTNEPEEIIVESDDDDTEKNEKKPKFKKSFFKPNKNEGKPRKSDKTGSSNVNTQATGNVINIVNSQNVRWGNDYYMGPTNTKPPTNTNRKDEKESEEHVEKNNLIKLLMEAKIKLSWVPHIKELSRKFYATLHSIIRLKHFLPTSTKISLVNSLLLPIIDYADVAFLDLSEDLLNKLDRLMNTCIRFIFCLRKYDHVSIFRAKLKWLQIRERRNLRTLCVLFSNVRWGNDYYMGPTNTKPPTNTNRKDEKESEEHVEKNNLIKLLMEAKIKLSWVPHIKELSRKFYATLHSIIRLKHFLPTSTKISLVNSLLLPIIDYADVAFLDLSEDLLNKLDRLMNTCIRFIFCLRKYDHVSIFRAKLKWLQIRERRNLRTLCARYKLLIDWMNDDSDGSRTLGLLANILWEEGERELVKELALLYKRANSKK
ncbi:putative RNA-directed DNA polymerase from transposon BS [Operophtera brumata]|uniref:Putative RNA-directed DNA polymerase from transposon BS n=1 Tax=Operophtera brumata TaxID=104452 RepID=A0A0L7LN18_OPEBR|nr:putative RNA-directed DNA polymerase from transposon BS [Operophtera brumata]